MVWYAYLAYFFGGAFLANGVPHLMHGISGQRFQSSFAPPSGAGESSPLVDVIWGTVNFTIGYVLIFGIGDFAFGFTIDILTVSLGGLIAAVGLASYFGRVHRR